jgi:F-type H+-transporting ATPase subunit gamma
VARLEDSGLEVEEVAGLPGSVEGVTSRVQDILLTVEEWRFRRGIERIMLLHHKPQSGSSYRADTVLVFPVDPDWLRSLENKKWNSRTLPMFTMGWRPLFASLIRQHIFVSVYRAFVESLASENAARLASMQAAEKNIDERLDQLAGLFHQKRQTSITSELLDIVAGFEALTGRGAEDNSGQEV